MNAPRRRRSPWPGVAAAAAVAAAVLLLLLLKPSSGRTASTAARASQVPKSTTPATQTTPHKGISRPRAGTNSATTGSNHPATSPISTTHTARRARNPRPDSATTGGHLSLARAIGQLIISTYAGPTPPGAMLAAIRQGRTGAVILMGNDTTAGVSGTRAAVDQLQSAARAGDNPPLLIMTDQEGGEVKRLPGPPAYAAAGMSNPSVAYQQGLATGEMLRQAGVSVDLAPVADVSRTDGFMTQEERTFGLTGAAVAAAACSFASGLQRSGVGYTLKHFPGLGDATESTDNVPVAVTEPSAEIHADDAAYRRCGNRPTAAVMVSSASYSTLTGHTPAVLSPKIYDSVMPEDGLHGLTMSDSLESGAMEDVDSPATTAINAGLDMVMYPGVESAGAAAYTRLVQNAAAGVLSRKRVFAAASDVLAYKRALRLAASP